ncbi:hypothetical protein ACWKWC_01635 [Geodermatophilus nigrescens]
MSLAAVAVIAAIAVAAVVISTRSGPGSTATAGGPAPAPTETGEPSTAPTTSEPAHPSSEASSRTSEPTEQDSPVSPSGDLGLTAQISQPACNGQWVVFVGAATMPGRYAADVSQLLETHPGAEYLLTDGSCSSLRQRLDDGGLIYAVYVGYFADQAAACSARDTIGGGAYVKLLDNVTPAEQLWQC